MSRVTSQRQMRPTEPLRFAVGTLVALSLCLAATAGFAQEAKAGDRTIPVSGGSGRLGGTKPKSDSLKAGGGTTGVFKRKSGGALDPSYDPAQTTKKLGKEAPGNDEPGIPPPLPGRPSASAPPVPTPSAPPANDDVKKIEDLVTFKSNFDKDIKCKRLPLNARVTLDFQDAPIESITKLISCWMNRNFVVASQKKGGKISILSPQPVSVYEAYRAFLSSLMVNGMSVTKKGDFYHIVDAADARSSGADVLGPKTGVPGDDNVVTRLVRMKNIDVKDVEPLVGKFKSKGGDVFVYAPNNTIIITDTGNNIRRIIKLLADVDVPLSTERIWIRPVQNMDATGLVEKITSVFGEGAKGGSPAGAAGGAPSAPGANAAAKVTISKAIADDRSNQIILICTRANYLKVDALIRKLDVAIPGEGQIHIHHLENADAEDVASTLSSLSSGGGGGGARGGAKGGAGGAKPAGGGAKGGGGSATLFEGDVKITAHKASNALVIESSLKDYVSLQKVIAELDRRRKQVYVEAVIMEISTSKKRQTQFAASGGKVFDIGGNSVPFLLGLGGLGMGGVSMSQLNAGGLAAGLQGPLMSVNSGNTGSTVPAGVTLSIPAFGFLVQAIQENSDVNILSTPHILTLNNEEAEITVGRKVPYRSASMGGMSGMSGLSGLAGSIPGASSALSSMGGMGMLGGMMGGMGSSMVQFINVDLTLKITPQINESNFIKLKIDEQLDEVEGMDPNLGPTTSKRKVNNTVVVRDQQPVVIGGLITDRETTGVAKIPILGDLPLLGMLFRKTTKQIEKKNLLLIIVPHIIKDPTDLERMHENKMEQIRDFADELATTRKEYEGKIDFRKKKGFLESLFQSVDKAAEERKMVEKAYFDNADIDLVGPPERHDLDYDPFKDRGVKGKDGEESDGVDVIDLPGAESDGKEGPGDVSTKTDGADKGDAADKAAAADGAAAKTAPKAAPKAPLKAPAKPKPGVDAAKPAPAKDKAAAKPAPKKPAAEE